LIALLAAIGLIAMASAATARADGVDRGRMDITNVVGDLVVIGEGSELVTYVGTIDFGDGDVYKMAFFTSAAGDPPPLDRWTRFEDRWEIYEFNSIEFFDQKGKLKDPFPKGDVVAAADDRGWGNFELNKFVGWGPGGFWTGRLVDDQGTPTPYPAAVRFVGPFWLVGDLGD